MSRINRRAFAAGSAALVFAPYVGRAEGKKTLRFVQNGNLTILDPIWTTAYVTRDHGYMIYDTLFATDESNAVKPQMVDKHEVSADKLTWTFTSARWAGMARRQAGDSGGLRRLAQALGRPRPDGTEADGLRRRAQGNRRQDLRPDAQGAVRPGARHARQAVVERAVHDAQADRRHRSVQADRQPGRLGAVHLRQCRVQARREARLHPEPQVQAARRARLRPRRRQDRQGRAGRVRRHARSAAAGERADRGRDRHGRAGAARSHSHPEGRQGCADRRLESARPAVRHPLQSPDQAVRQSQDPAGRALLHAPGGLPQGNRRRSEVLQGLHRRLRLRHAQRGRDPGRSAHQAGLREVEGPAQGGRLRRLPRGAHAVDDACRC